MVRVYRKTIVLNQHPQLVMELLRTPSALIPLWPFTIDYDSDGRRVRLQLKRFGLKMNVDYSVNLMVDEARGTIEYKCTAPNKMFVLTFTVREMDGKSAVDIEAAYSGDYERFSPPLLRDFVEELAKRLQGVIARSEVGAAASRVVRASLSDPAFIARAIVSGSIVFNERAELRGEDDVAKLLRRLAELSKGKTLLARIRGDNLCVRILFQNGEPVDALMEKGESRTHGLQVLEELLASLRGTYNVTAISV